MNTHQAERGQRMIPGAAIAIAVLVFIVCGIVFPWAFESERNPPPLGVQLSLTLLVASAMAVYVLLAGYVFRDARRRGMRHVLWTFIVVLVPNGIGFILYFVLRQPMLGRCPQCRTEVKADFNYCPSCHYQLKPVCTSCGKTAEPGSVYCPYCGNAFQSTSATG
jgi:RNA polymerase subunit RPABC4/transcription elongation factor Spt4